jgi:lipopolysaccharide/colanic/teichoic acid biosynthesis glycosyltransferase
MNPVLEQSLRETTVPVSRLGLASAEAAPARVVWYPGTSSKDRRINRIGSRVLNIMVALIGLILTAPIMAVLAVLVKLSSPGPIIFTQTRVGIDRRGPLSGGGDSRRKVNYGGRLFRMYKFRTMSAQVNSNLQVWADPNDKRVTPIGRVLRKYRLDELPQLINVLKGDMNVVGPRPEQPNIFITLDKQISGYASRQRVLPGITGWAQINHHYDCCVDDVKKKLSFDLEYIERQTPLTDLKIMARTIPVIITKRGAW